jgi:hypothetical protein
MGITEYINKQEPERKKLLVSIHKIILDTNNKLKPKIGGLPGKEMLIYEIDGAFIYALANVKTHISLHNLVMYAHKPIWDKYSKLWSKAKFGKGCINFKNAEQAPHDIIKELMIDSTKAIPVLQEVYKARMAKKK